MLRILIKKQMMEIYRSYFYNPKTGEGRSRGTTIAFIALFILLVGGLLGGIFTWLSNMLCKPFVMAEADWLYFAFMALLAIFLGAFGSIFNTYSSLYLAKDNDLLLSMPIPVRTVMAARLWTVYLMGLIYSSVVIVPAVIVYCVTAGITAKILVGSVFSVFIVSVLVLLLSCVLGYIVAVISRKLRHKNIITVLVSIVFIGAYYLVCMKSRVIITELTQNAAFYGAKVKASAYPLYLLGRCGEGNPIAILIVTAVVTALAVIVYLCMSKSFIRTATTASVITKSGDSKLKTEMKSVNRALLGKELKRFISSSNYMLNCGLGILLLPAVGVFMLLKGKWITGILMSIFGDAGFVLVLFATGICMISCMNNMTAASVSLEGRSVWLLQALPVKTHQVLMAKASVQIILSGGVAFVCAVCVAAVVKPGIYGGIMLVLLAVICTVASAFFGLVLNLKNPNLAWTSETVPVKQSLAIVGAIFAGWIYAVIISAGFYFLREYMSAAVYMMLFAALTAGLCAVMYCWLKTEGSRIFESL